MDESHLNLMAELTDGMLMTFQSRLLPYVICEKYAMHCLWLSCRNFFFSSFFSWKTQGPSCPSVQQVSIRESESIMCMLLKESINLRRWELLSCHVCPLHSLKPYIVLHLHLNHYRSMVQSSIFCCLFWFLIIWHPASNQDARYLKYWDFHAFTL